MYARWSIKKAGIPRQLDKQVWGQPTGERAGSTAVEEVLVAAPTAEYPTGHPKYSQGYAHPWLKTPGLDHYALRQPMFFSSQTTVKLF